jgi:hypothetical protein
VKVMMIVRRGLEAADYAHRAALCADPVGSIRLRAGRNRPLLSRPLDLFRFASHRRPHRCLSSFR